MRVRLAQFSALMASNGLAVGDTGSASRHSADGQFYLVHWDNGTRCYVRRDLLQEISMGNR